MLEAMFLDTSLGLPDRFKLFFKLFVAVGWLRVRDAMRHGLHRAQKLGVLL